MAFQLKRPILVGGLGLTVSLWLLQGLHPSSTHIGGTVVWGAIALGSSAWWLRQFTQTSRADHKTDVLPIDRATVDKELAAVEALINQLATEFPPAETDAAAAILELRLRLAQLPAELERKQARLSIMGGKSVGKTTLTGLLASNWRAPLPLSEPEKDGSNLVSPSASERGAVDTAEVQAADLVMFVTTGDLTDSEFQAIDQLLSRHQRVLLVFNKQDQYLPTERLLVLQQLRDRMHSRLAADDVVAIAAHPSPVKVRQHQADGSVQEQLEQPVPDVAPLAERLKQILAQEGQSLILATVHRRVSLLKIDVLGELNRLRRDRALPLIEQSQWIAAATAFANPVPSLDLLATAAINAQLILDLGEIYQQRFSLQQAKTVAIAMAELMVKLGLVELSSQAIAPLLKSNTVTYVAGGLLQGVSAAYLTRIAALTLVDYFQEQSQVSQPTSDSPFQLERLAQTLKAVFQANQRGAFLQTLVKQTVGRLAPESPSPKALGI